MMFTCSQCGNQIAASSAACPHCGLTGPKDKKTKFGHSKIYLLFAVLWVVLILILGAVFALR